MNFYTIRELRSNSKSVWENLSENNEVVITNNGKPMALMLGIDNGNLDEAIKTLRQLKAMRAVNNIRTAAVQNRLNELSDADIEDEIAAARKELG